MADALTRAADLVWSYPVVGLCLLSALWFTISLRFIQLRALPHAIALLRGRYDRDDETGTISHFQALAAALSGTIGIGNIAGVAIAIGVGGPGSILWMWITGLLGMATKFVECTLGTRYREVDPDTGQTRGGPMFYIVAGLGPRWRPLAWFYALTIAFAGFGFTCMFQSNQAAAALSSHFSIPTFVTGGALALLTGAVILGGIQSIGRWAARIVPTMVFVYVGGAVAICLWHYDRLPEVLMLIVHDGFTGDAAAGGALGAMVMWGVRRAIFSNEAGLGSASIAHAAVKTDEPVREGVVASLGPLLDTVIVSGATAFVIVLSGNYGAAKDPSVMHLEPIAPVVGQGGAWTPAGPGWLVEGDTPPPLRFDLSDDALAHDAVRLQADVHAGRLDAVLMADQRELSRVSFHAEDSPTSRSLSLELSPEVREAADGAALQVVMLPSAADSREPPRLSVAAPKVIDERNGIALSAASFDRFIPGFGSIFISVAGFLFALSTMITWSYYGEIASTWAFGRRALTPYRLAFVTLAFVGAVRTLDVVVSISDLMVGLLVIPNVIALLVLSPRVARWTRDYFIRLAAGELPRRP